MEPFQAVGMLPLLHSFFCAVFSWIAIQGDYVGAVQATPCSTQNDCPDRYSPASASHCCHEYGCCTEKAYLLIEALRTGVVGQCAKDIDIHYSTCFKRIAYCFSSEVPSTTDPANCFRAACFQLDDTTCCLGDGLQHTRCSVHAKLLVGSENEVVCMPRSCVESRQVENFTRNYNRLACAEIYDTEAFQPCDIREVLVSCDGGYKVTCTDSLWKCVGHYGEGTFAGKAICSNTVTVTTASISVPPSTMTSPPSTMASPPPTMALPPPTMKVTSPLPVTSRARMTLMASLGRATTRLRPTNTTVASSSSAPTIRSDQIVPTVADPTTSQMSTAAHSNPTIEGMSFSDSNTEKATTTARKIPDISGTHVIGVSSKVYETAPQHPDNRTASLARERTSSGKDTVIVVVATVGGVCLVACIFTIVTINKFRKSYHAARTRSSRFVAMEDRELLPQHTTTANDDL